MKKYFALLSLLLMITSCKTLMTYTNILNCDFRVKSATDIQLAGINVQGIKGAADLNLIQAGQLAAAYFSGNLPLQFQLNLEGKNPNSTEARLAQFDWIVSIDDIEMAHGTHEKEYILPPNEVPSNISMMININLKEVLNDKTKDALINFGFNLADASNKPTRIGLKIRPTIYVGQIPITYPGYITVGTSFGHDTAAPAAGG